MGHLLTTLNKRMKIIAYDSFTRADNASTLGGTETGGQVYGYPSPSSYGVLGGKAYNTNIGNVSSVAVVDALKPDVSVEAQLSFGTNEGLAMRVSDSINLLAVRMNSTGLGAFRVVGGVATSIGNYAFTPVVGQVYKITAICEGSTITIMLDNVIVIPITNETYNQSLTLFGLRSVSTSTSTTGKFDEFKIVG